MSNIRFVDSVLTRIVAIVVVLSALGGAWRYVATDALVQEELVAVISAQQVALARDMARDVDYRLATRKDFLTYIASQAPIKHLNQPAQLNEWLSERRQLRKLFSLGLTVLDREGNTLAQYPAQPQRPAAGFKQADYFLQAMSGEFAFGRAGVDAATQIEAMPMAAPIFNQDGQVVGALVGMERMDARNFLDSIHDGKIGESGGYLLISPRDSIFIAATKAELNLKPVARPGVNPLHDRAMAGFRGSDVTTNAQGEREISAMASVPTTDWFVVARLPVKEALRVQEVVRRNGLYSAVIATLVLIGLLVVVLLYFCRPLRIAARQASQMTSGALPMQPIAVKKFDEVGYLVTAFNSLLERLAASQYELDKLARSDALTGLPNRRELLERLNRVMGRAQRQHKRFALLNLDLDGFKKINDQLGHHYGDQALVEVVRRLSANVRDVDVLSRFGGDEFVVIVTDLDADPAQATVDAGKVADKCIAAIQAPFILAGHTTTLGLSVGIAMGDWNSNKDDLQLAADKAMYEAKNAGGNRYCLAR